MSGLTPAPTKRVNDPSGVATHGVALWSAGQNLFRSARNQSFIVMASHYHGGGSCRGQPPAANSALFRQTSAELFDLLWSVIDVSRSESLAAQQLSMSDCPKKTHLRTVETSSFVTLGADCHSRLIVGQELEHRQRHLHLAGPTASQVRERRAPASAWAVLAAGRLRVAIELHAAPS